MGSSVDRVLARRSCGSSSSQLTFNTWQRQLTMSRLWLATSLATGHSEWTRFLETRRMGASIINGCRVTSDSHQDSVFHQDLRTVNDPARKHFYKHNPGHQHTLAALIRTYKQMAKRNPALKEHGAVFPALPVHGTAMQREAQSIRQQHGMLLQGLDI